ncbi:hypothetical protein BST61_g3138 [Cercospora zeina]
MRYNRCKKVELVKFAADRGVQVNSKGQNGPTRNEHIAALVKADKNPTFRFSDLPPELRNVIYADLLTLKSSFSCFPQILRTCRQINQEATSLLYGLNYVDIVIRSSGVHAHGQRCGSFMPVPPWYVYTLGAAAQFTMLTWPDFLCRAQHLRVIVPEEVWVHYGTGNHWDQRVDSVSNTVYSLCHMLREGNSARHLRMVVEPDERSTFESMQAMFYPFRLLGEMSLEMVDSSGNSLANLYTDQGADTEIGGLEAQLELVSDCLSTINKHSNGAAAFAGRLRAQGRAAQAFFDATVAARQLPKSNDGNFPLWINAFHAVIVQMRIAMEFRLRDRRHGLMDPELLSEVYRLLCLEVDVTNEAMA